MQQQSLPNGGAGGCGPYNDATKGLVGKRFDQVRNPAKTPLVEDNTFVAYFGNLKPFERAYWHDRHVAYLHVTRDKPDFQRSDGWTFVYNDP